VIDLDCHNGGDICIKTKDGILTTVSDPARIQEVTASTLNKLVPLWESNCLPEPLMVTFTGRGLQLIFVYERGIKYKDSTGKSVSSLVRAHKNVVRAIYDEYHWVLNGPEYLDIDDQCSDISRVVRLPGTWNSKAGRFSTLIRCKSSYVNLFTLQAKYCPLQERMKEGKESNTKTQTENIRSVLSHEVAPSVLDKVVAAYREILHEYKNPYQEYTPVKCCDSRYTPLLKARMRALIELQKKLNACPKHKGYRHNLTFLYCNCIYLINKCKGRVSDFPTLEEFNRNFSWPMREREVKTLIWSIVKRNDGYYYRNDTFVLTLKDELATAGLTCE
jgi:hypothetical protein